MTALAILHCHYPGTPEGRCHPALPPAAVFRDT